MAEFSTVTEGTKEPLKRLMVIDRFAEELNAKLLIVLFMEDTEKIHGGVAVKDEHLVLRYSPKIFAFNMHRTLSQVLEKLIAGCTG